MAKHIVKLRCLVSYDDVELGRKLQVGDIIEVSKERATNLLSHERNIVELLAVHKITDKKNVRKNRKELQSKKR